MLTFPCCNPVCSLGGMVVLLAGLLLGCTPRSAAEVAADRARVLGTWTYRTDGIGSLQHGTLQIRVDDGQLAGRLQDNGRGRIDAEITLRGYRMELTLSRVRIRGRLEHGRFTGSVHRPTWDAASSKARSSSSGSFVARRVRKRSASGVPADFGCPSLLHESSYACSPFRSP